MVDKMYLRIPSIDEDYYADTGKVKKLGYSLDGVESLSDDEAWRVTNNDKMTKEQRDNLMIDIERAILTSKEGSEQVYNPGTMDGAKRQARILTIIENPLLFHGFFLEYAPNDKPSYKLFLDLVNKVDEEGDYVISLKELEKFVDNGQQVNLLLPQTYVWEHQQTMTGAGLTGLYANGASINAKMQESDLVLKKPITINNRKLVSFHDQRGHDEKGNETFYIQDNISQYQQASVDNAKELLLYYLHQNTYTAGDTLVMLRLGMTLQEATLMGALSFSRLPSLGQLNKAIKALGGKVDYKKDKEYRVTSEELIEVLDTLRNIDFDNEEDNPERLRQLKLQYRVRNLFNYIQHCRKQIKLGNEIMKADSPNNALAPSIPEAILQRKKVDVFKAMTRSSTFPFVGEDGDRKGIINRFVTNDYLTYVPGQFNREEWKEELMNSQQPYVQGFYSLGIDLPLTIMQQHFIQGNLLLQEIFAQVAGCTEDGLMKPEQIKTFYREFIQFLLTKTKTFGDDGSETFDKKRLYYIYDFPKTIKQTIKNNPVLKNNPIINRLVVVPGFFERITLPKSGSMQPEVKEFYRQCFSMLLYDTSKKSADVIKFAKQLFMYSFYKDGFNFGRDSFGTYFDYCYWKAFPEALELLREYKYDDNLMLEAVKKFLPQYLANHAHQDIVRTPTNAHFTENADGTIYVRGVHAYSKLTNSYSRYLSFVKEKDMMDNRDNYKAPFTPTRIYEFVQVDEEAEDWQDNLVLYRPLPVFDEPVAVYNFNSTSDKMEDLYWQDREETIARRQEDNSEDTNEENPENSTTNQEEPTDEENLTEAGLPKQKEESDEVDDPEGIEDLDTMSDEDVFARLGKAHKTKGFSSIDALLNQTLKQFAEKDNQNTPSEKQQKLKKEADEIKKKQNPC